MRRFSPDPFGGACTSAASPYRRATARIGTVMLLFLLLFNTLLPAAERLSLWIVPRIPVEWSRLIPVVETLLDGAAYMIAFLLPAALLQWLTPRAERRPLPLAPHLPPRAGLWLPAALAVIYAATLANAFLLRPLLDTSQGVTLPLGMSLTAMLLLFLRSVLIPAICEEVLFRGAILSALLPYGKQTALFGSALLFGLMHQNPTQWLFTTVGGLVMGLITLRAGSLWGAVLVHLFYNLLSVLEAILFAQLPSARAEVLFSAVEVAVIGGGVLCLVMLLARHQPPRQEKETPTVLPPHPVRNFFTLPMSVFTALCGAQMALLVVLAMLSRR